MMGKSKRVGARDGQWNRARRAAALALSVSLLACDPSMMRGARAKVARVPGAELERAAREEAETDSLHLERFGTTPLREDGSVVIIAGTMDGEPFRLWFIVPGELEVGKELTFHKHAAALLTVGRPPYRFVSHRLSFTLEWKRDGTAFIDGSATHGERGKRRLRFVGPVQLAPPPSTPAAPYETAWSDLGPRTDYTPDVLPYAYPGQAPPPGYQEHSSLINPTPLIAGAGISTLAYGIPLLVAASKNFRGGSDGFVYPIVGPFVVLDRYADMQPYPYALFFVGIGAVLLAGTQIGGLFVMADSLRRPNITWVRSRETAPKKTASPRLRLLPVLAHTDAGFSLSGSF